MRHFPAFCAAAAFLAVAAPLSGPAAALPPSGPQAWHVFDSDEVLGPGSEIAFTALYPPGFVRKRPVLSPPEGIPDRGAVPSRVPTDAAILPVQLFRGPLELGARMTVFNIVVAATYESISQAEIRIIGTRAFWDSFGRTIAGALNARFDGADPCAWKGLQCGNIYMTEIWRSRQDIQFATLKMQRQILKGNRIITVTCDFSAPFFDVMRSGFTSRDNPAVGGYFLQFPDSLEFKR
ncbi:MAG: hypothetical protein LBW85_11775 [Deltaproteobacteria bacterium]|jgi:hypothetical protein|nr:hypothetical protein [Deltaproteobacteria bacterium]